MSYLAGIWRVLRYPGMSGCLAAFSSVFLCILMSISTSVHPSVHPYVHTSGGYVYTAVCPPGTYQGTSVCQSSMCLSVQPFVHWSSSCLNTFGSMGIVFTVVAAHSITLLTDVGCKGHLPVHI